MANNSTNLTSVSSEVLLLSVIFKFIALGIGLTGNTAVIIYNIFMLKEKTATSYLIANLAIADLLVCLTFYPIWIVEFIQTILGIDSDQNLFCKMSRSSIYALMFASVATLLAITIDRYLFIVKPLKYADSCDSSKNFSGCAGNLVDCFWPSFCIAAVLEEVYNAGLRSACYLPD